MCLSLSFNGSGDRRKSQRTPGPHAPPEQGATRRRYLWGSWSRCVLAVSGGRFWCPGENYWDINSLWSLQMGSWENWQKPAETKNSYESPFVQISVCGAWSREEAMISCRPFLTKSTLAGKEKSG